LKLTIRNAFGEIAGIARFYPLGAGFDVPGAACDDDFMGLWLIVALGNRLCRSSRSPGSHAAPLVVQNKCPTDVEI
jgi:hypothetical protein